MTIARTTIKDVQLVKVGSWGGMTGQSTITEQHLADAVAAYADPEIDRAVLKIGHDGDLNLATGHPALGWIENLKLSGDKKTLIGDLTDIPSKLASIIPKAYRRRSVEMSLGVTAPSGKKYAAALTGLALLGAKAPAVKGLDDILAFYASEAPGMEDDATREQVVAFAVDGDTDTAPVPHTPDAGGDAGDGSNTPDERGADVALSEALKKKLGLAETATDAEVEAALEAATLAAPVAEGTEPPAAGTPAAAATAATAAASPDAAAAAAAAPAAVEPVAPVALAASPATVVVSAVQFAEMNAQLSALTTSAAADRKKTALDNAIKTGRISPAERVAFATSLDANEEAGTALLNSLAPRFNVSIELGADHAPQTDTDAEAALLKQAEEAGI